METEKEKVLALRMPESLHRRIKLLATSKGQSMTEMLLANIEKFVSYEEDKRG